MNGYLRQSTASQSRLIGPFVDDVDFKTSKTALTIANTDIKLRANGTTLANKNSGGGTHQVNGMYSVTFDETDTANVGELFFSVVVAGALPVFGSYVVLEEAVYDAFFAASALGYVVDQPVNATKIGGTTQTGRDIGASVLLSSGTGAGQVDLSVGKVLLQATQTGVTIPTVTTLTNAPSDSSGVQTLLTRLSDLRAGYLDNLSAGAAALESSLQALITTVGAAGAGLTATASAVWSVATRLLTAGTNIVLAKGTGVTGFNDLSAAQVNAEVDIALADYDGPTHAEMTAELAAADDAVLSAIGSLNNLSQANVRDAVGLASANLDTQLAAINSKTTNLPSSPAATSDIPNALAIADAVWDETAAGHSTDGTTGGILQDKRITGYHTQVSTTPVDFTIEGGRISPAMQGESVITVQLLTVVYDGQYTGMLFLIFDLDNSMRFSAAVIASSQSANTFTLSRPVPSVGAIDPLYFLILPSSALTPGLIADAVWDEDIVSEHTTADTAGKKLSQALVLYEGS